MRGSNYVTSGIKKTLATGGAAGNPPAVFPRTQILGRKFHLPSRRVLR